VIDRPVIVASPAKPAVGAKLVRVHDAARLDMRLNDGLQGPLAHVRHDVGHHVASPFKHPEYDGLARRSASALSTRPLAADVGFVGLNIVAARSATTQRPLAVRLRHVFPDLMRHAPCGLVGHAKLALQFHCGNTMARRSEQVHRKEPLVKWQVRPVHEGARAWENLLFAVLADVSRITREAIEPPMLPALWAGRLGAAVAHLHQVAQARLVIGKLLLELVERCHVRLLCPEYRRTEVARQGDTRELKCGPNPRSVAAYGAS